MARGQQNAGRAVAQATRAPHAQHVAPTHFDRETFSGEATEQPDDDEVLDMMSPNVDAVAQMVRAIEPENPGLFKFEKDGNGNGRSVEYEKFMQEPVTVIISKTTNKTDPWVVPIGVNGDTRYLPRGIKIRIQRKFVERLAQVHERSYSTTPNSDPSSDTGMLTKAQQAQPYQFHVLHDPNPKGRLWLQAITRAGSRQH